MKRWLVVLSILALSAPPSWAIATDDAALDDLERQVAFYGATRRTFDSLEEMVRTDPANPRPHLILGMALEREGYADVAAEQYRAVEKLDHEFARDVIRRFRLYLESGAFGLAATFAPFVRTVAPHNSALAFFDGVMCWQLHRLDQSMAFLRRASRNNPPFGVNTYIGAIYAARGKYDLALNLLNRDLSVRPNSYTSMAFKGEALLNMGRYSEALQFLRASYQSDPTFPGAGLSYARALVKMHDFTRAAEPCLVDMSRAQAGASEQAKHLLSDIVRALNASKMVAAIDGAAAKLKNSPLKSSLYFGLADIYDSLGSYPNACMVRRVGLELTPNYTRGYYLMGRSLENDNRYSEALQYYRLALNQDPGNRLYDECRQRVAEKEKNRSNDLAAQLKEFLQSKMWHGPEKQRLPGLRTQG